MSSNENKNDHDLSVEHTNSKEIATQILPDESIISMDTDGDDDDIDIINTKGQDIDLTESCPDIYRCPISKELMTKPVMLHDDGHTYNEESLKLWLSDNNRSPLTGVELKNKSFTRNYALQHAIEQFENEKKLKEEEEQQQSITPKRKKKAINDDDDEKDMKNDDDNKHRINKFNHSPKSNDLLIYNRLREFLSANSLDQYVSTFINAGFVSMSDFSNIQFGDLVSMNIPIIHSRRLITAIEKYHVQNEQKLLNLSNLSSSPNKEQPLSDIPLTNSIIIRPGKIPRSQNSAPLNCNILLLGDAYVGKTSLRKRLELDDFVLTQATQGVELTCLLSNFQGEDLQITIWDPAGQERYAPITKTFFRRAHAAAIIFAADDISTWKHVEYWMHELEQNAPDDIEYILICNKIDLLTSSDDGNGNSNDIELTSLIKNAINVAAKKRIPFYTTSAKSGESVKQAFQELVSQLLNNRAILEKLYNQRDGNLGDRASSYHGPNPYDDNDDDDDDEDKYDEYDDDEEIATKRNKNKKTKKLKKLKNKLSWRSRKNNNQFREYTENDYDKAIKLEKQYNKNIEPVNSGCCNNK